MSQLQSGARHRQVSVKSKVASTAESTIVVVTIQTSRYPSRTRTDNLPLPLPPPRLFCAARCRKCSQQDSPRYVQPVTLPTTLLTTLPTTLPTILQPTGQSQVRTTCVYFTLHIHIRIKYMACTLRAQLPHNGSNWVLFGCFPHRRCWQWRTRKSQQLTSCSGKCDRCKATCGTACTC